MSDIPRQTDPLLRKQEQTLMAHRYLYYVKHTPVIPDYWYDKLDSEFLEKVPETINVPQSPIHVPGSSIPESYSADEIKLANKLLKKHEKIHEKAREIEQRHKGETT